MSLVTYKGEGIKIELDIDVEEGITWTEVMGKVAGLLIAQGYVSDKLIAIVNEEYEW